MTRNRSSHRFRQALGTLACLIGALLFAFPGSVAAADPARPAAPVVSHHPAFVTETGDRKWDDCIWASGAMLIEAWTGHPVDRVALRAASGASPKGASDLRDLRSGVADLLGLDLPASPRLGDRMTWRDLLHRLEHGGSAVVVGWYSSLPARLTRWDRKLAAMDPTPDDGHAMFVTDYRPSTGKLWLMDPLGRGDYAGEWVDARVIRDFVWTTSWGYIYAAATPEPVVHHTAPRGASLGAPSIVGAARAGTSAVVSVPVVAGDKGSLAPLGSVLAGLRAEATFDPVSATPVGAPAAAGAAPAAIASAAPAAGGAAPVGSPPPAGSPAAIASRALANPTSAPTVAADAPVAIAGQPATLTPTGLVFAALLPTAAGTYEVHVRLLDADGQPLRGSAATLRAPIGTVTVWDRYGAVWDGERSVTMAPGVPTTVLVHVVNAGTADWLPSAARVADGRFIADRVVATWLDSPGVASSGTDVALAAGADEWLSLTLAAPTTPGVYHVLVDLVDPVVGPLAARGVPPLVITVTVDERAATNL